MAQKLFSELNLRDNVSRNGFSLDHNVKFSAQVGELLPICCLDVMPTDKFQLRVSNFTRTAPVETAAYTRIKEYFDWFFVPARILQKDLPNILSEDTRNPYSAQSAISSKRIGTDVPNVNLGYLYAKQPSDGVVSRLLQETNQFGFNRGKKAVKLLNYLGYGHVSDSELDKYIDQTTVGYTALFNGSYNVSLLPLAAYQSIYYYWFRNTQWEENQPQNYNFDWMTAGNTSWYVRPSENPTFWSNPTIFDLQYCNYPKDLIFGLLPNSQMGEDAEVSVNTYFTLNTSAQSVSVTAGGKVVSVGSPDRDDNPTQNLIKGAEATLSEGQLLQVNIPQREQNINDITSVFSILELRKQEAIQKYREILGTGENNYKSILEKLFNANVSDKLANIPYYLGGSTTEIKISEVENTNLSTEDSEVLLKGKGVGSSTGDTITFESKDEYGFLMCIYHAVPVVDYKLNALSFSVTRLNADDFAKPIFDSLGMVEFPTYHLDISSGLLLDNTSHLGYTIRNYDYKTALDRSLGAFRDTELESWYSPVDFEYLQDYVNNGGFRGLNASFFKVNPHLVDPIFKVSVGDNVNTDHLRVNANFSISAVRPLSRFGVPYAK